MDSSRSEKPTNLISRIEEMKLPKECADYKELNLEESGQDTKGNVDVSTEENNVHTLSEYTQRETGVAINTENKRLSHRNTEIEKVDTAKKFPVEILNVELVVPGSDNFSLTDMISLVDVNDKIILSSNLSTKESASTKQVQNKFREGIKVNPTDVSTFTKLSYCAKNTETNSELIKKSEMKTTSQVNVFDDTDYSVDVEEGTNQKQVENEVVGEDVEMESIDVQPQPKTGDTENDIELVKASGLGLLAQYQSDDDAGSVVEVPITTAQDYRNQVVEIDSDSISNSSSSDSSDVECLNELRKTIEKRIDVNDEDDGEDEENFDNGGKKKPKQRLKMKGELLLEDLPPIQDLQITVPEDDCIEFGKIYSIVDQLVLVNALPNSILLDLETVIFLEKGQKVLGEVFDVLGQVADPLYCIRFNSNEHIKEKQIQVGDVVYVAPKTQYTQYVILSSLLKTKGSDASWENDMEPPPKFLDYSDDEQEQFAKRQLRNKDRPNDNDDPTKRKRTEDDDTSSNSSFQPNPQYRIHYERRKTRGCPRGNSNLYSTPRFNDPLQNQQRPTNHHRSSWHSNYYPQNYSPRPTTSNYRMQSNQNAHQSPQPYNPNMQGYGMPSVHNMPYPPPQSIPYGTPPMFPQHPSQPISPNTFIMRSITSHDPSPHAACHQQYNPNLPPPPGSQ